MKRILFVDDELKVLEGLERMLRTQRNKWEMVFASSGAQALQLLEGSSFDVIVTDMRMPEMDGARLLQEVQKRFPGVVRLVLSGYFEMEMAMRAVPVAHQFLAKPCDATKLRLAIEHACEFASILTDEGVRKVVGAIGALPSVPRTCAALLAALQDPDIQIGQIGRIIEQDVGMTAKILQLVNSAFFGLLEEMTTVRAAVSYLGLDILKQLVLSAEISRTFQPRQRIAGFSIDAFQNHSRQVAAIAARLPASRDTVSAAVVAALLHDCGKLVLAVRLPREFELALERAHRRRIPLHQQEYEELGTSHAEIGAYLLALWGLPLPVVDAVRRHHRPVPPDAGRRELDELAITHIADGLAREFESQATHGAGPGASLLDLEYLTGLGVVGQLSEWRELVPQVPDLASS
jgi:HD-like signal output (HDOD) protein/CheY-like chemotaxis protein